MKNHAISTKLVSTCVLVALLAGPAIAYADSDQRTVIVREGGTASLLDGAFTFKLSKINGYSVKVRTASESHVLKVGESFAPEGQDCAVIFEEIATETRLARFLTNCS